MVKALNVFSYSPTSPFDSAHMLVRSDDSEYSSLLDTQQQHDRFYNSLYPPSTIFNASHQARQRSQSAILSSCASVNSCARDDQSVVCRLFNKRLGQYDDDRQELLNENTGVRVWYESYSSIGNIIFYHT
ncbi:predicted protein [Lichtheimia corymbifera JMRC:FSU:9682]|uniref:Uncharacterized protein n=1 Tax=Lichtheimia corymbifera JMRC:FSU:9682 TaxID=1263082 RepID=A0A068SFF6_9FUNG|nr:predicted protein [Lichtheimia corymbifera JMRC:FSU:9682]